MYIAINAKHSVCPDYSFTITQLLELPYTLELF